MHVNAKSVCLELMLQPLPRLITFFEGPCSLSLQFILGIPGLLLNPATSHCSTRTLLVINTTSAATRPPTRRRACCVDHKSDDMSRCCGTNPQQIEVMKFAL